ELVGIVGAGAVEDELEDPEPGPGELMGAQWVGARALLDRFAELSLDLLSFRPERLQAKAGTGFEQREHAVGVVAERLAEVRAAVAGGARVNQGLEQEVLLLRLPPEQHRVVAEADVVNDVRIELFELQYDRSHVVDGGEVVVVEGELLHAE